MTPIATNEEATAARYALECALLAMSAMPNSSGWQLFAGENLLAAIPSTNYEFSVEWGKLIFAWWDDQRSQSWRVIAYRIDDAEILLQVTRGLGREIATITLRNEAKWRERVMIEDLGLPERRRLYPQTLARLLAAHFSQIKLQSGQIKLPSEMPPETGDVTNTVKRYARLRWTLGGETILAIGVNEAESQPDIDGVIAAGLVWLAEFNRQREARGQFNEQAKRLWFCLPRAASQTVIERLTLLHSAHLSARLECFEIDEQDESLRPRQFATQNELLNTHPRELDWPEAIPANNVWRERILRLGSNLIEARQLADHESFTINGLEFARLGRSQDARLTFGVAGGVAGLRDDPRANRFSVLSETNFPRLERLIQEIIKHRSAHAPDRRHPLYRLREEAWLESLLRRDIHALDAGFNDRFVYSQIPAWRGDQRSVIDLLAVKQTGHEARLAVIEIKATEDAQLPMQGLDYWLRVEQARLRGEFARRGLFAGIELVNQPPLLYLIAPRLRFHRTFATVARCLSSQIEAYQVGLNASWRDGVRVRSIERVNQF